MGDPRKASPRGVTVEQRPGGTQGEPTHRVRTLGGKIKVP